MSNEFSPDKNLKSLINLNVVRTSTVPFFVVTQLNKQYSTLVDFGVKLTIITSDGPEIDQIVSREGIKLHIINIERKISIIRDIRALCELWFYFIVNKPTIVHSTTPKAGMITSLAAFFSRVPIRLHTFTGQPWVSLTGVKKFLARLGDFIIGRLCTFCYADSASQVDFLLENRIVDSAKIKVIGAGSLSGVDLNRFDPSRFNEVDRLNLRKGLGIPHDAVMLLFVGRVTGDKGIGELVEAFLSLKSSNSNLHLVLVGPIEDKETKFGNYYLDDLFLMKEIHFVGYTATPEIYMFSADILCLPSYREGFGTVVIEAAAMKLPAIASDIYGLRDAVVHNQTGILCTPRDISSLSNAINSLVEDKEMRILMGCNAQKRVIKEFDSDVINLELIREYASLLSDLGL
jgi:glycosyltransferase involved in cell wall biosynthesis